MDIMHNLIKFVYLSMFFIETRGRYIYTFPKSSVTVQSSDKPQKRKQEHKKAPTDKSTVLSSA